MLDPDRLDPLAYVATMVPALGFDLPPERLAELAEAFALVVRIAQPALRQAVPADAEPAPVFVA